MQSPGQEDRSPARPGGSSEAGDRSGMPLVHPNCPVCGTEPEPSPVSVRSGSSLLRSVSRRRQRAPWTVRAHVPWSGRLGGHRRPFARRHRGFTGGRSLEARVSDEPLGGDHSRGRLAPQVVQREPITDGHKSPCGRSSATVPGQGRRVIPSGPAPPELPRAGAGSSRRPARGVPGRERGTGSYSGRCRCLRAVARSRGPTSGQ